MPIDDLSYIPYSQSNFERGFPGIASNNEIHSNLLVKLIASRLYCAGWQWVKAIPATTRLFWNMQLTVTIPVPPPVDKPLENCKGEWPFYEFIVDNKVCQTGDWLSWFDPYRQLPGDGCGPNGGCMFPLGTTAQETRNNLYACDVLAKYGLTFQDEKDVNNNYTGNVIVTAPGGYYGNGLAIGGNGIRTVGAQLWGGGYHLRSQASNTGAKVDVEITEENDGFLSLTDGLLSVPGLNTSKLIFRVYRTPTTTAEMDSVTGNRANAKFFALHLWPHIPNPPKRCMNPLLYRHNYAIWANPYQFWIYGLPTQAGIEAGYTDVSKPSAVMVSVPFVDDEAITPSPPRVVAPNLKPVIACGTEDNYSVTSEVSQMKSGPFIQRVYVSWGVPASGADVMIRNNFEGIATWESHFSDFKMFGGDPLHFAAIFLGFKDHTAPDQDNDNPILGRAWNCAVMSSNDYKIGDIEFFNDKEWVCVSTTQSNSDERAHASVWLMVERITSCPPNPTPP